MKYPEVLTDYIKEFQIKGRPLIRSRNDEQVLNNIFLGIHPDAPYDGHVDVAKIKAIESGKRALKWSEFMSILFVMWSSPFSRDVG